MGQKKRTASPAANATVAKPRLLPAGSHQAAGIHAEIHTEIHEEANAGVIGEVKAEVNIEANAGVNAVQVRDLAVSYGPVTALTQVDLELAAGKIWAILGMNGSGKSTFFKALMGQVHADRGDIKIFGADSLTARKNGWVGYVPQTESIDLHFPLRVVDVVMMGRYGFLGATRRARSSDHEAVDAALAAADLTNLANRPIGALSGGQRKRVFVARAIVQGAKLLILDEPFAGVDKDSEAMIVTLLQKLVANQATVLISTHDLSSVPKYCDQAVLINRTVHFKGSVQQALQPDTLVRAFTNQKGE